METITIDAEKCKKCGLCADSCANGVIVQVGKNQPTIAKPENCIDCGHCVAVCANDSMRHARLPLENTRVVDRSVLNGQTMEHFLSSKRSVRHYSDKPIEKEVVEHLLNTANVAPSSKNCQERAYVVVYEAEKLSAIRTDLVKHTKKILVLLKILIGRIISRFLPSETVQALRKIVRSFEVTLEKADKGEDSFFHNAPCAVFICGIEKDVLGRDNAVAAQHYLMMQAQAMGIGSCVIGYAQSAPKILARHLDIPRFYKVFGVVTLGYPKSKFKRTVERNPAEIIWYGQPDEKTTRIGDAEQVSIGDDQDGSLKVA